jgi:hypothetical protein
LRGGKTTGRSENLTRRCSRSKAAKFQALGEVTEVRLLFGGPAWVLADSQTSGSRLIRSLEASHFQLVLRRLVMEMHFYRPLTRLSFTNLWPPTQPRTKAPIIAPGRPTNPAKPRKRITFLLRTCLHYQPRQQVLSGIVCSAPPTMVSDSDKSTRLCMQPCAEDLNKATWHLA